MSEITVTLTSVDTVADNSLYNLILAKLNRSVQTGDSFKYDDINDSSITEAGLWVFPIRPKSFYWYEVAASKWQPLTINANGGLVPYDREKKKIRYRRLLSADIK
tara:strand:- start:592 stop:906 length:315 start_codon:yes stop_codon:yes gene_type:complete